MYINVLECRIIENETITNESNLKIKYLGRNVLAPKLNKGDTIGIVAPSNFLRGDQRELIDNLVNKLNDLGFKVKFGKNLFNKDKYDTSAGSSKQRAKDFNDMISDDQIKAIWCFQGGDTANQILDLIDFKELKSNPKIILGKSDIDVLLLAVNKVTNLITFHGCDAKLGNKREFDYEYTQKYFLERLVNKGNEIKPSHKWKCLREGKVEGKLLGCNLSSILKLAGTQYFPNFDGAILFLEGYKPNCRQTIYRLTQLKLMGVFDKIKGIVVGHIFGDDKNNTFESLVFDLTKEFNLPLLKIEEFGHYCPHTFLPIGANVLLDATNKKLKITNDFLS